MTLSTTAEFRPTRAGVEFLPGRFSLPRHRHLRPYVNVVLSGAFDEIGYTGRVRAVAGDVLVHPPMDCHANRMVSCGAGVLRLTWHREWGMEGYYHLDGIDDLVRIAEVDPEQASQALYAELRQQQKRAGDIRADWPDILAEELSRDPGLELGGWARRMNLSAETVSRGFKLAYGVSPIEYRAELKARAAWLLATGSTERLSAIASKTGFADQAHMTRWVHRVTGAPPAAWRKAPLALS